MGAFSIAIGTTPARGAPVHQLYECFISLLNFGRNAIFNFFYHFPKTVSPSIPNHYVYVFNDIIFFIAFGKPENCTSTRGECWKKLKELEDWDEAAFLLLRFARRCGDLNMEFFSFR